jgi:hypothetical protein
MAVAILGISACGTTTLSGTGTGSTTTGTQTERTTTQAQGAPTTTQAPSSTPSMWDRPALSDPQTITISSSNHNLKLSPSQDYILRCRPGTVVLDSRLVVWGGHDVELEDCHLHVTQPDWAAYLQHQTGTLWVHDVYFGGTHLTGGLQMQEPGANVVMRDVLFDRVYGSYTTNHAELLQTWCGPKRLLIDGLSGSTTYQGLFMLPNQWCSAPISQFDLRHVNIDDSQGAVALWLGDVNGGVSAMRLNLSDVYVTPNPRRTWRGWWLWPQPPAATWSRVIAGSPPGGTFVRSTSSGARGVDEAAVPAALPSEQN